MNQATEVPTATTDHCAAEALQHVALVPLDSRGRRKWGKCPQQVAAIVRCFRASESSMSTFARAIGMPQTVLSRCDRGLTGKNKAWRALRRLIKPRAVWTTAEGRRVAPAPSPPPAAAAEHKDDVKGSVRLLPNAEIEVIVVSRRVYPYGHPEHARLLPAALAAKQGRKAASGDGDPFAPLFDFTRKEPAKRPRRTCGRDKGLRLVV